MRMSVLRLPSWIGAIALTSLAACSGTEPPLEEPGYRLQVSAPGFPDTTLQGDSLYWRVLTGSGTDGAPTRQLTLEMLVLDPPALFSAPLAVQARWYDLADPLPAPGSYPLGLSPPDDVVLQVQSELGIWASASGGVRVTAVTDTSLVGSLRATLVPVYPPNSSLPEVEVQASFWAPRAADVGIAAGQPSNPLMQPTNAGGAALLR